MAKLSQIIEVIKNQIIEIKNFQDFEVTNISDNSKNISLNSGFIAIKGSAFDGNIFISDAIKNGAKVIFSTNFDQNYEKVVQIKIKNDYLVNAELIRFFYNYPDKNLKLLGVTGTNGKTSSVFILKQVLSSLNLGCGLISTIKYFDGKSEQISNQTTPTPKLLFKLFAEMEKNKVEYVPMEVSSHSLAQYRNGLIEFDGAIFTNLTGDHLDYHENMENYFECKKRLFLENLPKNKPAIINIDDTYGEILASELKKSNQKVITFGIENKADFPIQIVKNDVNGVVFELANETYQSNLFGIHNIYNLSGVIILLCTLNILPENIKKAIKNITIDGRLEKIEIAKNIYAFVDYAHTDDALKNTITSLKKSCPKKLITLFGCGGNRDKTKRPRMGKIASELSDFVVITTDNPRNENPRDIIDDIVKGLDKNCKYIIEIDRLKAIKKAVAQANEGDFILIAGKGHENYQEINDVKYPFDDREILRSLQK